MSVKNPVTPPGIDPGTVRLVAQRLNHYATPDPSEYVILLLFHYKNNCTKPSQCYVIGTLPVLLTSICGAQKVQPSGALSYSIRMCQVLISPFTAILRLLQAYLQTVQVKVVITSQNTPRPLATFTLQRRTRCTVQAGRRGAS